MTLISKFVKNATFNYLLTRIILFFMKSNQRIYMLSHPSALLTRIIFHYYAYFTYEKT